MDVLLSHRCRAREGFSRDSEVDSKGIHSPKNRCFTKRYQPLRPADKPEPLIAPVILVMGVASNTAVQGRKVLKNMKLRNEPGDLVLNREEGPNSWLLK